MKLKHLSLKRRQKGLSIVEMLVVLVVVAIIGAVVWPQMAKVKDNAAASAAARAATDIIANTHFKLRRPPYTAATTAWGISAGVFDPASVSGTTVNNTVGYTTVLAPGKLTGGATNGALQITDVIPTELCLGYLNEAAQKVDEVLVGTTVVKPVNGPLNDGTAATACAAATATVSVVLRDA